MENAVCHFVFYTGPRKGEAQLFTTARVSIGRAANCDFRLEAFQLDQVAPHHAELLLEESAGYCLYDLGTKSGTFVNGERVHERCFLVSEDYLRFGQDGPEVIFRTGHPVPGKQPLPEVFPVTAELEFFSGSDAGRIFPVNAATASNIGRRADLEVPLDPRGDMIVSGNHCNIRYVNGHFVLTDTSRNGTYVNNDLVDQPMEILDGDVIMLGDGGPQARFHVDQARRHYPNHRVLSPVAKPVAEVAPAGSSFTPVHPTPVAPATLASAKPFATGSAATAPAEPPHPPPADAPLSPEAEEVNLDVEAAHAVQQAAAEGPLFGDDLDLPAEDLIEANIATSVTSTTEPAAIAATASVAAIGPALVSEPHREKAGADPDEIPATDKSGRGTLAAVPKAPRTISPGSTMAMPSRKILIISGIAAVVLICIALLLSGGGDKSKGSAGQRGDYAADLGDVKNLDNPAAAFGVQVPAGWGSLSRDNYVSIESADKNIAVDYVRDPRANEEHLKNILLKNGATAESPDKLKADGKDLQILRSSVGNVRRLGLLLPAGNVPIMVTMETTQEALDRLDGDALQHLLVDNVKAAGPMPEVADSAPAATLPRPPAAATTAIAVAPSPTPIPTVTAAAAAGDETSASTGAASAAAMTQPAAAETTSVQQISGENSAQAALAAQDSATSPAGPVIKSNALKMTLTAPTGWTGKSEEADEMVMLSDDKGLVVRIARDPGDLDAGATFKAMEDENWKRQGVKDTSQYHAGEFVGKGQNLLLVLIPEKSKSTLLIYATSPKDFTEVQRYAIKDILVQLIPQ